MTKEEAIKFIVERTGVETEIVAYDLNTLLTRGQIIFGNVSINLSDVFDMQAVAKAMVSAYKHIDIMLDAENGVFIQVWD